MGDCLMKNGVLSSVDEGDLVSDYFNELKDKNELPAFTTVEEQNNNVVVFEKQSIIEKTLKIAKTIYDKIGLNQSEKEIDLLRIQINQLENELSEYKKREMAQNAKIFIPAQIINCEDKQVTTIQQECKKNNIKIDKVDYE